MFIDECSTGFLLFWVEWVDLGYPSGESFVEFYNVVKGPGWREFIDGSFSKTSLKLVYGCDSLPLDFSICWASSVASVVLLIG